MSISVSEKQSNMDDLANRVQSLPPELYNHIYDDVFTSSTTTINVIGRKYKPPSALQVDRRSRFIFAMTYYSEGTTIILDAMYTWNVLHWLRSLNIRHLARLRKAKHLLTFDGDVLKSTLHTFDMAVFGPGEATKQRTLKRMHANDVAQLLKHRGLTVDMNDLRVEAEG
ncbi:hypothetical protein LTR37_003283 [Vermiconidia calcicola]|uniref:Uncharacterized protein n=1 Tax=Vermiconidia calcicola TaxID=1690605 RepID=A0ACC3NR89_9PEZI|nr:hypothetical protein LTR37_003283 [Vermiconidia calcicola]